MEQRTGVITVAQEGRENCFGFSRKKLFKSKFSVDDVEKASSSYYMFKKCVCLVCTRIGLEM